MSFPEEELELVMLESPPHLAVMLSLKQEQLVVRPPFPVAMQRQIVAVDGFICSEVSFNAGEKALDTLKIIFTFVQDLDISWLL